MRESHANLVPTYKDKYMHMFLILCVDPLFVNKGVIGNILCSNSLLSYNGHVEVVIKSYIQALTL